MNGRARFCLAPAAVVRGGRARFARVALAVVSCLALPVAAQLPGAAASSAAAAAEPMVVRVTLNAEDKGDHFVARTPDGDFLVKDADLSAMGFKALTGNVTMLDGEAHRSLRSMQGVRLVFQARGLVLAIEADPKLLPARKLDLASRQSPQGIVPDNPSGFFNYALNWSDASEFTGRHFAFTGEAGLRRGDYLLVSDGSTVVLPGGRSKFVRLTSSVTRDDRDTLQRWVAGDFLTQSREFASGVNLGGLSLSKLYGINPYLIQFPTQTITGTAALPSELEIYMDGQRIRTERIRPGEFELRDLLAYGGARSIQVLLRDSFGRVQQFDYSFYFSDRPLQHGLHEYSYNVGAFRRDYGLQSNRYGTAAYAMFHRYGVTDALTLGIRAEGTRQLVNAGPSATLVLGTAGVLNAALGASAIAGHSGAAASLAYNYQTKGWSTSLSLRRDWREFATLGEPPTVSNRKFEASFSASYYVPGGGTVSLNHGVLKTVAGRTASPATPARPFSVSLFDDRRASSLAYTVPLFSGKVSLTTSISHTKDSRGSRNEAFVGLIYLIDKDYTTTANVRADRDNRSAAIQLARNQPIGEGLGYLVSADRADGPGGASGQGRLNVQYNAPLAVLRGEFGTAHDHARTRDDARLSVAGGIAYAGGHVALGRPIAESFGIVKVGEVAGVRVLVNDQPMGTTDSKGMVFVPTLSPYVDSEVSIAPSTVPIDYSFTTTRKKISPSLRSGALIEFALTRIQAFTGTLAFPGGPQGAAKPLEFQDVRLETPAGPIHFQTGNGGQFYLENLKPGDYTARSLADGKACTFTVTIPQSEETFVDLPQALCRPQR